MCQYFSVHCLRHADHGVWYTYWGKRFCHMLCSCRVIQRKSKLKGLFWIFVSESVMAIPVQCPTKRYIVILFQPVILQCNYQTSTSRPPIVTWRYKSYCRDPIQAALNPSSAENILSQNNPNYDPNIECADSQRTVRAVASKQDNAVTLSSHYQGRKISIINSKCIQFYM